MANTITTKLDLDGKGFTSQLRTLQTSIRSADTATGKLKAGVSGLGQVFKANATEAAAAAGAALVAFGKKSVDAFQDAALAAGDFADATGVSVEESSKWISVADDFGLSSDNIQKALLKMNKELGASDDALAEYGVSVTRAADGTIDANATFIDAVTTIGAIQDPTKRAEAAQKAFGRSYSEVARLMEMDATDLRAALDSTSDAQIIDQDELNKARDFQATMDKLGDIVVDVQMALGEFLVENSAMLDNLGDSAAAALKYSDELAALSRVITSVVSPMHLAREATKLATAEFAAQSSSLEELNQWLDDHGASAEETTKAIEEWTAAQQDAAKEAVGLTDDVERVDRSVQDFADEAERAARETKNLADEYKALTGELSNEEAWLNVEQAIDDYNAKIRDSTSTDREKRLAQIDLKQELIAYLAELDGVPKDKQTDILALIDQGQFDQAERALNQLARERTTTITPTTRSLPNVPKFDSGGVMPGPRGEHNLALVAGGETILPTHKAGGASVGGGGSPIYLTVNAGMGANGAQVGAEIVKVLTAYERTNGKRWRS